MVSSLPVRYFVIGGGFAAAEEAVFLTKYARKVTIIVREEDFTCAKQVSDKAKIIQISKFIITRK